MQEHRGDYLSLWAALESIAPMVGCVLHTLQGWGRKHEVDTSLREGVTGDVREQVKALEREVFDGRLREFRGGSPAA